MARRSASARPIDGSALKASMVRVVNATAAPENTGQCDTRRLRAPA